MKTNKMAQVTDRKILLPSPKFLEKPPENQNTTSTKPTSLLTTKSVSFEGTKSYTTGKFRHPGPFRGQRFHKFNNAPHFASPLGMLKPKHLQPPPMFGPRGATIPPRYLNNFRANEMNQEYCGDSIQENFWCEPCDKEFDSRSHFELHKSEHKTCGIDGCTFTGHTSVVDTHIENMHNSGLYSKVKKTNTPEEIEKWRAERRKRYPTQGNVELRQKAQEARIKRGERISDNKNRFGNKRDRMTAVNRNFRDQKEILRISKPKVQAQLKKVEVRFAPKIEKRVEVDEPEEYKSDMLPFKGTANIPDYPRPKVKKIKNALSNLLAAYGSDSDEDSSSSDSDTCSENESNNLQEMYLDTPTANSLLFKENHRISSTDKEIGQMPLSQNEAGKHFPIPEDSSLNLEIHCESSKRLLSNDTESEADRDIQTKNVSDDEMPEEVPIVRIKEMITNEEPSHSNDKISKDHPITDDEMPDEVPIHKVREIPDSEPGPSTGRVSEHKTKSRKRSRQKSRIVGSKKQLRGKPTTALLDYSKIRTPQNTMLSRLLEADLRHERNVLLQCVRFVIDNQFFGIGQNQ